MIVHSNKGFRNTKKWLWISFPCHKSAAIHVVFVAHLGPRAPILDRQEESSECGPCSLKDDELISRRVSSKEGTVYSMLVCHKLQQEKEEQT